MDALVKYLKWFSEHPGICKDALSDILRLEHNEVLPSGNKLPSSFADAMKLAEPFLIQPILFHICPNDCILFRNEYANLDICPMCGASCYTKWDIPAQQFTYLTVGPRLVRLFGTKNLAEIIQCHGLHQSSRKTHCMIFMIQVHGNWPTQPLGSLLLSFAAYCLHSTQMDLIPIAKTGYCTPCGQ